MNFGKRKGYAPKLNSQSRLLNIIRSSNFDHAEGDGGGGGTAPIVVPVVNSGSGNNNLMQVGRGQFNKPFVAQIQLRMIKLYFTEAAGVYAPILPAGLGAGLNVSLPFFLFLNLDFEAGYSQLQSKYPQQLWQYNAPVVFKKDSYVGSSTRPVANGKWDTNVTALLRGGDVIIPFTATVAGVNYVALTIVRASDVAYASLLDATNSNTFVINLVRFKVATGQEAQFQNSVSIANETMFGKVETDPVNPESFQSPQDMQPNILDMDITIPINKQKGITSEANFDVVSLTWNLFIEKVTKIL